MLELSGLVAVILDEEVTRMNVEHVFMYTECTKIDWLIWRESAKVK